MSAGLKTAAAAARKLAFVYDYMGRRVKKAVYADNSLISEILFVYEGRNVIEEITRRGDTESSRYFVWGLDLSQSLQGAGGIGGLLCMADATASYYYLYDANGNAGQLVNSATGETAAHYEYDPFGNFTAKAGPYADANPFRFSTKYFDAETDLYDFGLRDYSAKLGRWISRDPIGEKGGINLFVFIDNNPICKIDLLGLTKRSDIAKGRLQYSCNCGWIDWGHALPGGAKKLWNNILAQNGNISKIGNGFKIVYEQRMGKFGIFLGYSRQYFVKFGLTQPEQESAALAIYKEVSEGFEGLQRWTTSSSGFSEEDLISNLIGFYRAVKGFTREQIEEWCHGLSIKESERVWDAVDGLKKNRDWKPVNHNDKTSCCKGGMKWPAQLDSVKPAPKGMLWRNWYEKDIEVF